MEAVESAVNIQMWLTFAIVIFAIFSYALERLSLELTSLLVVVALLLLFQFLPADAGTVAPSLRQILAGFADPALIAILALLVIGQGLVHTGALDKVAQSIVSRGMRRSQMVLIVTLALVLIISAIMNNTPVVVIFIPILSMMAARLNHSVSMVMIPLSFAAILGGNLTLIGSSTNLLVSGALEDLGQPPIGFFDFSVPGAVLAVVGFLYLIVVAPRLLKNRASLAGKLAIDIGGKQFIVQLDISKDSPLAGLSSTAGLFAGLPDLTVRMVQRGEQAFLPPFDDITLRAGDELVVAATRKALAALLKDQPEIFHGHLDAQEEDGNAAKNSIFTAREQMLAEAVIAPVSRWSGMTLANLGFHAQTNCIVLGIQRRSRMIRSSVDQILLLPGDVLLIMGQRSDILSLRSSRDALLMEWSAKDLPRSSHAKPALGIFALVVMASAGGLLPITTAALTGAAFMVAAGCLTMRQAILAVDQRILMLIGAALAMGTSLNATGGATFLAHGLLAILDGASPAVVLSAFFLLIAALTNVLSNNATAVLFTPIAVSTAAELGIDPMPFVVAVIFAANCSFATPMGYQTNLLVMGPGHYRFSDFAKVGFPLILLLWVTFTAFAPWYYGIY
jgi:di/tricarboxylate transporter